MYNDFAQQVHYSHNPLQSGPMYFKTARKCAVFGVCCEGLSRHISKDGSPYYIGIGMVPSIIDVWGYDREFCSSSSSSSSPSSSSSTNVTQKLK